MRQLIYRSNGVVCQTKGSGCSPSSRSRQTRAHRRSESRESGGSRDRRTIIGPQLASVHHPGDTRAVVRNPQYSFAVPCMGMIALSELG